MLEIPGYHIHALIYGSVNSLVYRGIRCQDNLPVILKVLKADYPTPAELTRYRTEYEITRNLNLEGVVRAYSLQKYQNTLVMILEDFGGESLQILMARRKFTLFEFLTLAIKITEILGEIHARNIIHKDINPSNIVFNPATGALKLIDFGISTVLVRQNPTLRNPNVVEGTLAYMSPEQTGRMNRAVDYRTDFYSLGVTFYELLTQKLPFEATDAMELVHCHIAKQPIPPQEQNREIPKTLSDIVMKLLSKTAEERYQSAWGLIADLETCLTQCKKGQISYFPLGYSDVSNKFQIPQKLYGREQEIKTLLTAFERVSTGSTELMLVSGYSGIGKTALIQEIYKPITRARGYFISGKFDQFQRNIPYSAVVNAFSDLVRQLLTESEEQLNLWREKLLAAFGLNGQVIIDVIPEVELIVGPQPAVPELEPTESQNLFNLVFTHFIRVFCQQSHPLVIFLDDLQWADSATLKLIELMMTDNQTQHLFVLGAYRDNKVNSTHPLMMTLEALEKEGAIANQITLAPLALEHISQLIAETLYSDTGSVRPLAELVVRKTGGNPFFVNEFLKTLHTEGLITLNLPSNFKFEFDINNPKSAPPLPSLNKGGFQKPKWNWDIAQIEAMAITDNVVELMIGKLQRLPDSTQQVLRLAACVGNTFDLKTLSLIHEKEEDVTFSDLMVGIQSELVLPISELETTDAEAINSPLLIRHYKFLHDRVQQAAYALIDKEHKKAVHFRIGRLLLANTPEALREEKIFEIVAHLNKGRELIADEQEQVQLAKLNLEAGKKAKDATAYAAALQYLTVGMERLKEDVWKTDYDLAFSLYKERADVEYLNGNLSRSQELIDLILAKAKSALDKAETYYLLIVQYTTIAKESEAIKAGRKALNLLGISWTEEDLQDKLNVYSAQVRKKFVNKEISSLIDEPTATVTQIKLTIKLLNSLLSPAYVSKQDKLFIWLALKIADISLEYGMVPESSFGFSSYGVFLGSGLGDYKSGYEFGLFALNLSKKFGKLNDVAQACYLLGNNVQSWVKPLKEAEFVFNQGIEAALASGNFLFLGYILIYKLLNPFYQGKNLEQLLEDLPDKLLFTRKNNHWVAYYSIVALKIILLNLTGRTSEKLNFDNEEIREAKYLEQCYSRQNYYALCHYLILKSKILYLYGKPTEAIHSSEEAEKIIAVLTGKFQVAEHNFYNSLSLIALYREASEELQKQYWDKLEANQKQMKIWAENCPENFEHKYLLVAAQMAHLSGEGLEAIMDLYDRAIKSACENEFLQDEAIANELAAKFWLSKGKEDFAKVYMMKAHYCYQHWGAKRKVEDLEEKYPHLLTRFSVETGFVNPKTTNVSDTFRGMSVLDLATVTKASLAISSDLVLDKLLGSLMKITIENAGAEKGFLILETKGKLLIEAEGVVDTDSVTVLQSIPINTVGTTDESPLPSAIINYVARTKENVVLNDATREGQYSNDPYIKKHQPKSILCAPLLNQGKLSGILYLENSLTTGAFTPDRLKVLNLISAQAAISIENARFYRNMAELNTAYSRFVPSEFLQFLDKESIVDVELGDSVEREMSVLFADIRSFTTLSEGMTPQENFKFINTYLSCMEPAINAHHGFIDKYIGDGIMALFGGSADDAVQAGIAMLHTLAEYNQHRASSGYVPIQIGIGINTGSLMLGTVGGHNRMDSTVISDAVNSAARIESLTKEYGVGMLISHQTFSRLQSAHHYAIRLIGRVKVKGKSEMVSVFEVFDADPPEVREGKLATKSMFEEALLLYNRQNLSGAKQLFNDCLGVNPMDRVAQIYLGRCQWLY